jgi:predicted nucleic acid-binding protein
MIVLDANILIRAALGRRVRELLDTWAAQGVRFFCARRCFRRRGEVPASTSGAAREADR